MSRGIPPNTPGPSYSFGKAERFPKQKQSETPGPGAYNPNELKSSPSYSFSKEKRFQNSTNTTSHSKKVRDLIPPFTRSPARIIDSNKIDQLILNDAKEAGISYFRNEKDPEHLEHTYTFQNRDKTKTLKFIGISHLDNLKRHIEKHPSEKDALLAKINQFMEKLKMAIKDANPKHATLIIEGMNKFTPGNSEEDQQALIDTLKDKYLNMDWEDINAFINHQNASELEFAVLLAAKKGMNIISSESDTHQVTELCRRLESRDLMSEDILLDQCKLDLKECAFFYFCCRDLIRWHSEKNDERTKQDHLNLKIQKMIDRYSAISPFSGYNFETIQSVSKHIWGEGKLYDYDIANQIEQLIAPFPIEYIDGLRDIPEGNKQKIQIMNSISQLLTHIRNRQIVDESIRLFENQNIVIPVFGKTHGHSCFHAFKYVMQNI